MNDIEQKAITTISAIEKLINLNRQFIEHVETAAKRESKIGNLSVTPSALSCECAGHHIKGVHRPIALENEISAIEYSFVTSWKKEEIPILRLYLQPGGILTLDANGSQKLCDFNNSYIKSFILAAIWESLLASPIFTPIEG